MDTTTAITATELVFIWTPGSVLGLWTREQSSLRKAKSLSLSSGGFQHLTTLTPWLWLTLLMMALLRNELSQSQVQGLPEMSREVRVIQGAMLDKSRLLREGREPREEG